MIQKKTLVLTLLIAVVAGTSFILPAGDQTIDRRQFIGTWVDEEDSRHQWVFTYDRLTIKYTGAEDDVYAYTLSTTSPQCGENVSTTSGFTFLSLTKMDTQETTCYYVNGFAEVTPGHKTLSLSEFNRSGAIILIKQ